MVTIKGYTNNPELRKKEVIPGTFDAVFKAVLTEEKRSTRRNNRTSNWYTKRRSNKKWSNNK